MEVPQKNDAAPGDTRASVNDSNSGQNVSDLLPPKGIPLEVWQRLATVGTFYRFGKCWVIKERNAEGEVIGTAYRSASGDKDFTKGGKRGLILDWPLPTYAGTGELDPVWVCEGASDTAAMMGLGFTAVGVPSAGVGGKFLASLLSGRHVVICQDVDRTAGQTGAKTIHDAIAANCASVRIIVPPGGAKDAREAVIAGATAADFANAAEAAEVYRPVPVPIDGAPVVVRMANVQAKPIDWLWPHRFPRRMVSVLAGKPGEGKSFLTVDMAARVSTGRAWPDGSPCLLGDTLLVSGEDDPATVLRPRLDGLGADAKRVHLLRGVLEVRAGNAKERMFSLANLGALEAALAALPNLALVVIDPIGSFLGGKVDAHRDNEVRERLAPLAALAEKYNVAMLVVAHHNKSNTGRADDMILGSRAFTGLARCVVHLMVDPKDAERRLLLPGKTNIGRAPKGLAFRITGDPPRLEWESAPVDLQADGVLAASRDGASVGGALDEAVEWLRDVLSPGPMPATEVRAKAEADGIANRTLDRAKQKLGVQATREGYSNQGRWMWVMPHSAPDTPKDANPKPLADNDDDGAQSPDEGPDEGWGEVAG